MGLISAAVCVPGTTMANAHGCGRTSWFKYFQFSHTCTVTAIKEINLYIIYVYKLYITYLYIIYVYLYMLYNYIYIYYLPVEVQE